MKDGEVRVTLHLPSSHPSLSQHFTTPHVNPFTLVVVIAYPLPPPLPFSLPTYSHTFINTTHWEGRRRYRDRGEVRLEMYVCGWSPYTLLFQWVVVLKMYVIVSVGCGWSGG